MKIWGSWENVRRQVAIGGRVVDGQAKPVVEATITITTMPEAFSTRVSAASAAAGSGWEDQLRRIDRTVSRADGFFYFMDLPSGQYGIQVTGAHFEPKTNNKLSVKWDSNGNIERATVDLKVSENM